MWKYFVLGLLAGWLIEWVIDWVYWRRTPAVDVPFADGPGRAPVGARLQSPATPTDPESAPRPGPASIRVDADGGERAVESNAGATTSADTPAGRVGSDAALGTGGAVSTSSATLTSTAPVYRQEDLEAIDGIGPKIGALLRNNGITTFAQLAVTPSNELARIVASTGEPAPVAGVDSWAIQAARAAAQDWAGLAKLQAGRRGAGADAESAGQA